MVLLLCVALAWTTLSLSFVGLARRVSAESTVALRAEEGAKSSGGTPVVDDSDFSDSDGSKESKEKRANFDDILTEADNFATSIERKSRRSTAVARVSLEDELRDLSKRKRWTGSSCLLLISSDSSIGIQTFKRELQCLVQGFVFLVKTLIITACTGVFQLFFVIHFLVLRWFVFGGRHRP